MKLFRNKKNKTKVSSDHGASFSKLSSLYPAHTGLRKESCYVNEKKGLFERLNLDPILERRNFDEAAVFDALDEAPVGACEHLYPFQKYGKPMRPLFPAVRIGATEALVERIVNFYPAAVDDVTSGGWTILHEACQWDVPYSTLRYLVKHFPQLLRHQNNNGETPLHTACRQLVSQQFIEIIALADPSVVSIKDQSGLTPLDWSKNLGASDGIIQTLVQLLDQIFYIKLVEPDDRSIHFKLTELVPLIENVHHMKLYYSLARASARASFVTNEEQARYIEEALWKTAKTTNCTDSVAVFKLILQKATEDCVLINLVRQKLDREAEVCHTANAPFVKEIWTHIRSNTSRIEGLETNVQKLSDSLERLKAGIRFQKRVEAVVGFISMILNAFSAGVAGSAVSTALSITLGSIVDFGDVAHIQSVAGSVQDVEVKTALEAGLKMVGNQADCRLLESCKKNGNPLVAIAYTAAFFTSQATFSANHSRHNSDISATSVSTLEKSGCGRDRFIDRIEDMEDQVGLSRDDSSTAMVLERVENLELQIFGSKHDGPLTQRLAKLEAELGMSNWLFRSLSW